MSNIRQTSSLAVISLIAGIAGWSVLPVLGSIGAIITGHLARSEIRRQPEQLEGDGLAIAGLVMGWLSVTLWILVAVCFLLFFGGIAWLAHQQA